MTSSSALIVGDHLFVATSNGVDWSHINIPSPLSPSWIALNKKTGVLIGEDGSGASKHALHAAWSFDLWKLMGKTGCFGEGQMGIYMPMLTKPSRMKKGLISLILYGKSIAMNRVIESTRREERFLRHSS